VQLKFKQAYAVCSDVTKRSSQTVCAST